MWAAAAASRRAAAGKIALPLTCANHIISALSRAERLCFMYYVLICPQNSQ
jgi:hypothetical protein